MTNPLLTTWETPFGLPPYDLIADADYAPAVDAALVQARAAIAAIAGAAEPPSFANTIEALELADATLNRVLSAFWTAAGADSNPAREALERDFAPLLSAYGSEVSSNKALFARVEALWDGRAGLGLECFDASPQRRE